MKKSIISFIFCLALSGVSYAQTTTISTNPNDNSSDSTQQRSTVGAKRTTDQTHQPGNAKGNAGTQPGKATNAGSASNANGNAKSQVSTGGNAGKASGSQADNAASVSTTSSSAATGSTTRTGNKTEKGNTSLGAINKTEPDTTVKEGSGSSPKNTKNQTGKTGNYKNEATKKRGGN